MDRVLQWPLQLHPDDSLLQSNQTPTQAVESLPVLREEVEEAVRNLRAGRSPGVDNIPSDLLKNRGGATTTILTVICQKTWEMKEWPGVDTITHHTITKERHP